MAERPHIILPRPRTVAREQRQPFVPPQMRIPSSARQGQRLGPKFQQLQEAFERHAVALRADAAGVAPEEVIVLETIGSVQDFIRVVRQVQGLEWLGEWDDEEVAEDDDFGVQGSDGTKKLDRRLYLVMSNQRAIQQVMGLWQRYQANLQAPFPRGSTPWRVLFEHLRDVRLWGTQDRLQDTGVMEYWNELVHLQNAPERIRFEAELWYRERTSATAAQSFSRIVAEEQGRILSQAVIPAIAYHGVLIDLPRRAIEAIIAHPDTQLLRSREVMYFRPVGQSVFPVPTENPLPPRAEQDVPAPNGDPIAAVLDGLPIENHTVLAGRLIVDDPLGWAATYPTTQRHHGTAMASLVVRGELDANDAPAARPVYVRPILRPDPADWRVPPPEGVPLDMLPVDLMHTAIRRMLVGEGAVPASAPTVRIINLSVADPEHQFDRVVSAWARLLDWLSWQHNVLFIVSAGNQPGDIELDLPRADLNGLGAAQLQTEVIKSIANDIRLRRLLSPAEAINVLTIGAIHSDGSNLQYLGARKNPFEDDGLPSPINALGHGFRRSVKPEILLPGGRQLYAEKVGNHVKATLSVHSGAGQPGHRVACPGTLPGDTQNSRYARGTSNAAALATRHASRLFDRLVSLRSEPGGEILSDEYVPHLIKALLVHGASWGDSFGVFEEVLKTEDNSRRFRDFVGRFFGYGASDSNRVISSADHRATLLGCGSLRADEAHAYAIPLPPSLSGRKVWRRLTITLAWLSPINPRHRSYRRASLWFDPPREQLQVNRMNADWRAVQRGTVQHEVLEGDAATAYADGDTLQIQINCRADAGALDDGVRYGLAVSLEVAEDVGIQVYNEVSARIRPAVPVIAGT